MSGRWTEAAWDTIDGVHRDLPGGVSIKDRTKAIDAAYPFGLRAHHPYKCWLRARKKYLDPYRGPKTLSPLEQAIADSKKD